MRDFSKFGKSAQAWNQLKCTKHFFFFLNCFRFLWAAHIFKRAHMYRNPAYLILAVIIEIYNIYFFLNLNLALLRRMKTDTFCVVIWIKVWLYIILWHINRLRFAALPLFRNIECCNVQDIVFKKHDDSWCIVWKVRWPRGACKRGWRSRYLGSCCCVLVNGRWRCEAYDDRLWGGDGPERNYERAKPSHDINNPAVRRHVWYWGTLLDASWG